MENIMGFSSKVSLSHKKKAIKSLEKLYEENDSSHLPILKGKKVGWQNLPYLQVVVE